MKTISITVYEFDELSDKAKQRARDWYREVSSGDEWWEHVYADAENVGLKITAFDLRGMVEAKFMTTAKDTALKIKKEHGEQTETYKTAIAYLNDREEVLSSATRDREFLYSLCEDYRIMLQHELEYIESDENVDEGIRANEYTFTESGKREG